MALPKVVHLSESVTAFGIRQRDLDWLGLLRVVLQVVNLLHIVPFVVFLVLVFDQDRVSFVQGNPDMSPPEFPFGNPIQKKPQKASRAKHGQGCQEPFPSDQLEAYGSDFIFFIQIQNSLGLVLLVLGYVCVLHSRLLVKGHGWNTVKGLACPSSLASSC